MKILDRILFRLYGNSVIRSHVQEWNCFTNFKFGEVIFRNCVEMMTDLTNDVEWGKVGKVNNVRLAEFKRFFRDEAKAVLWRVFRNGYAVIGIKEKSGTMYLANLNKDYRIDSNGDVTEAKAVRCDESLYVMRSDVMREEGRGDYDLLRPFIEFLDNTLNASNTLTSKMGAFVVASPATPNGSPTPVVLNDESKKKLEEDIEKEYGALRKQRQLMILPRGMNFETVNLCSLDVKLNEKVRLAILAICDRVKVPANQLAIIDANASKALANGGEIVAGDLAKYKSFERLLNETFVRFAEQCGMKLTYTIYNKPQQTAQTNIEL